MQNSEESRTTPDINVLYRRYAQLLLEHEGVRRTPRTSRVMSVRTWRWVQQFHIRRGDRLLVYSMRELSREERRTAERMSRRPESVGAWWTLRFYAASDNASVTGQAVKEYVERYPLGKMPQCATINCEEYRRVLRAAADLCCDEIVAELEGSNDTVPWGEGNPRVPESVDRFERICRVLRDRDPAGLGDVLDSVELPRVEEARESQCSLRSGQDVHEEIPEGWDYLRNLANEHRIIFQTAHYWTRRKAKDAVNLPHTKAEVSGKLIVPVDKFREYVTDHRKRKKALEP